MTGSNRIKFSKNLTECEWCHEKFAASASDRIITVHGDVICDHCAYKKFVI